MGRIESYYLCASLYLERQVLHTELGNLLQQRLTLSWVFVDPRLGLDEHLAASTLYHIAQKRPWSTAEANQWYAASKFLSRQGDGLVYIVQLLCNIYLLLKYLSVLLVFWCLQRFGEVGPLLVHHYDFHTHCLWNNQDVGEDDGRIDEAFITFDWLQGERRGDLGAAATFEKVVLSFGLMVLGKVATGYVV